MDKDEIDKILLVGGSSRIPKIKQFLIEFFDDEEDKIHEDVSPDEAVAQGATLIAGILGDYQEKRKYFSGVVKNSIGIETADNSFDTIIRQHSSYPCEKVHTFVTSIDDQKSLLIRVKQGEKEQAHMNE